MKEHVCIHKSHSEIITQLKVIAQIKERDKLCVCGNHLTIDSPHHLQCVSRFMYRNNREKSIDCISYIIYRAIAHLRDLKESIDIKFKKHDEENTNPTSDKMKNICEHEEDGKQIQYTKLVNRGQAALENAKMGIYNLSTTYADDAVTISNLEYIIENIQDFLTE